VTVSSSRRGSDADESLEHNESIEEADEDKEVENDRFRCAFLDDVQASVTRAPQEAALRHRDTIYDERLLTSNAVHRLMANMLPSVVLSRTKAAIDAENWSEAAMLLGPLLRSFQVPSVRSFANEVVRCVFTLFFRSGRAASPQLQSFAELFYDSSRSHVSLLWLVYLKMATKQFKTALLLLHYRLAKVPVLGSTFRVLAALLAYRVFTDDRPAGSLSLRQFQEALEFPDNMPLDLTSPPEQYLCFAVQTLKSLVIDFDSKALPAAAESQFDALLDSAPPSSEAAYLKRIMGTWARQESPAVIIPLDKPVQELTDEHGRRPRPSRALLPRKTTKKLIRVARFVEPQQLLLDSVAVEQLSGIYESVGLVAQAESLCRNLLVNQPTSVFAHAHLLAFWERQRMCDTDAYRKLARRLFELDATHAGAFAALRDMCGDPGPNVFGSDSDVLELALRRVEALPDDAGAWLWLVRLVARWRNRVTRTRNAAFTVSAGKCQRKLDEFLSQQREFQAFWASRSLFVSTLLPAPPRVRTAAPTDLEYSILLYQCAIADMIVIGVPTLRAFLTAVKAVLHPMDTDPGFCAKMLARVRRDALASTAARHE
jgi:hypothetical protein